MKAIMQNFASQKMLVVLALLIIGITSSAFFKQPSPWKAPASADSKKSPLNLADPKAIAEGKAIYVKECQSCHGKKGKGDGPSAAQLDKPAGDFTKPSTQGESDGALFWKTSEGRKPMPSFKKKLSEDHIWHVIAYMRTMK